MIVATVTFDLEVGEEWKPDEEWMTTLAKLLLEEANNSINLDRGQRLCTFLNLRDPDGILDPPKVSAHDVTVIMGRRR